MLEYDDTRPAKRPARSTRGLGVLVAVVGLIVVAGLFLTAVSL
jgi:hypothetical protein